MWRVSSVLLLISWIASDGCGASQPPAPPPEVTADMVKLPGGPDGLKFAVIGDTGTGKREQYEIAGLLAAYRKVFPFEFVLMLGDNMYGGESPKDFERKFEAPYKPLLDAGVKFYAAIGNHDEASQRFYKPFNMGGERYYSFEPKDGVRFFALDSTDMSRAQLDWIDKQMGESHAGWKIAFFHHPLYSSGKRHGPDEKLREQIEPLLVKYGVDAVLSGHEHFYQRIKPQQGIYYFIEGGSAKVRRGNIRESDLTAKGFDTDRSFLLMEIVGDRLHFQAISRTNETVDSGEIARREAAAGR